MRTTRGKVRVALEALSLVGDISVSLNSTAASGSLEWLVTFLNNAGDLPPIEVDDSGLWGGISATIEEERAGTSTPVSGSFELSISNSLESVALSHDASAAEVRPTRRACARVGFWLSEADIDDERISYLSRSHRVCPIPIWGILVGPWGVSLILNHAKCACDWRVCFK